MMTTWSTVADRPGGPGCPSGPDDLCPCQPPRELKLTKLKHQRREGVSRVIYRPAPNKSFLSNLFHLRIRTIPSLSSSFSDLLSILFERALLLILSPSKAQAAYQDKGAERERADIKTQQDRRHLIHRQIIKVFCREFKRGKSGQSKVTVSVSRSKSKSGLKRSPKEQKKTCAKKLQNQEGNKYDADRAG